MRGLDWLERLDSNLFSNPGNGLDLEVGFWAFPIGEPNQSNHPNLATRACPHGFAKPGHCSECNFD